MKLYETIENIINRINSYSYFIQKALLFLKSKNLEETLKKHKFEFRYIINTIIDHSLIGNTQQFFEARNFLEKERVDEEKLEARINKINKNRLNYLNHYITYDLKIEKGIIKYLIKDESKIGKKKISKVYKRNYDIHLFNKGIIKNLNI